ncbi:hypothetical protein OJ996_05280 [Luteolibacter sp. GHJ8]|uniref:Uncharacterized protein n=1 Tax=Luteolibacter rhizosphaerae TaxID=2989719 RepID=A0ABT3FZG8_9BACT|nr:hypothetical protein [Luteolibacter rhizosphaerae]MCW1912971.1 hypothetical protein [Luteolibacter rhizosphaerae]
MIPEDYKKVPGWGVDADPKNDPTYPMRLRDPDLPRGLSWKRPPLQVATVEILHSNERPGLSAVFGEASPPKGVSGVLRRYAFRHSESAYRHWLPLMAADRIGAIEGIFEDLGTGRVPNIIKEKGWGAEWKFNRKAFATRILLVTAVAGAGALAAWVSIRD